MDHRLCVFKHDLATPHPLRRARQQLALMGVFFCAISPTIHAQSLTELMHLMRDEPTYQSAIADVSAAKARNKQALAALLPQINASANTQANQRAYQTRNVLFDEEKDRYNSHAWQLNLTQPLWRYNLIADKAQARAQVQQADFQLTAVEQTLFAKLVEAWFELLAARDQVIFSQAQLKQAIEQQRIVERGFELGLYGIPEQAEALNKYQQAQADELAAESEMSLKQAALELIIGPQPPITLPRFNASTQALPAPIPDSLETWLRLVAATNADIQSAYYAQEAAREEVGKQLSGYLPSVDLVASYGTNSQAVGGFPSQDGYDITQHYVGVQANWGLWSSGAQTAKVQEARARLRKAEFSLDNAQRNARLNAQQTWFNLQIAQAKQVSAEHAINSAQSRLRAAQQSQRVGLKASLEPLQAQQQLAEAQRDYHKAIYQHLLALIKLNALANRLTPRDIASLDALFSTSTE